MRHIGLHYLIRANKRIFGIGILGLNSRRRSFIFAEYRTSIVELINASAARYIRRYVKTPTVHDWNTLTKMLADEWSGNPARTVSALEIVWRYYKPIIIGKPNRSDGRYDVKLKICKFKAQERLERFRNFIDEKYHGKSQCVVCGKWGETGKYKGVKYRVYRFNPRLTPVRELSESRKLHGETCLSCYSRIRKLFSEYQESIEIRKLAKDLNRRLNHAN